MGMTLNSDLRLDERRKVNQMGMVSMTCFHPSDRWLTLSLAWGMMTIDNDDNELAREMIGV